MGSLRIVLGELLRRYLPAGLKAQLPVTMKARARSVFRIEPWPDMAVRHRLFRDDLYRTLRAQAKPFDIRKPYKPILERGHQASYLVGRWFVDAGVTTVFQVGYATGRYLFYLSKMGIVCGGTDLPPEETAWTQIPTGVLDEGLRRRLLRVDFFDLTPLHVRSVWGKSEGPIISVLFSEATFETMLPWREKGVSVPKYAAMDSETLRVLMDERFPRKLEELKDCFRNMVFIEPEPTAGGAGSVFETCARWLPEFSYSVWKFRRPFDTLFRLSPSRPTKQTVYAYIRDPRLLEALRAYADPSRGLRT